MQSLSKWVRSDIQHYHDPAVALTGIQGFVAAMQGVVEIREQVWDDRFRLAYIYITFVLHFLAELYPSPPAGEAEAVEQEVSYATLAVTGEPPAAPTLPAAAVAETEEEACGFIREHYAMEAAPAVPPPTKETPADQQQQQRNERQARRAQMTPADLITGQLGIRQALVGAKTASRTTLDVESKPGQGPPLEKRVKELDGPPAPAQPAGSASVAEKTVDDSFLNSSALVMAVEAIEQKQAAVQEAGVTGAMTDDDSVSTTHQREMGATEGKAEAAALGGRDDGAAVATGATLPKSLAVGCASCQKPITGQLVGDGPADLCQLLGASFLTMEPMIDQRSTGPPLQAAQFARSLGVCFVPFCCGSCGQRLGYSVALVDPVLSPTLRAGQILLDLSLVKRH